jgi:hypothetical protein
MSPAYRNLTVVVTSPRSCSLKYVCVQNIASHEPTKPVELVQDTAMQLHICAGACSSIVLQQLAPVSSFNLKPEVLDQHGLPALMFDCYLHVHAKNHSLLFLHVHN